MGYSGTDAYGTFLDTGASSAPATRANTELESHLSTEVDTGSKNSIAVSQASHSPHRSATSPR